MQPGTFAKYLRQLRLFALWMQDRNLTPDLRRVTVLLLIAVLKDIYAAGYAYATPNHLRSALAMRCRMAVLPAPFVTDHPSFLAALAGYEKLAAGRSVRREALRVTQVGILQRYALRQFGGLRLLQIQVGIALGYELLLRIEELRATFPHHITEGTDGLLLFLEKSKTDPLGRGIQLRISNPLTVSRLRRLVLATGHGPLFPLPAQIFNCFIQSVALAEGWKGFFSYHSLRHGKATYLWLQTKNIFTVMLAGRWKTRAAARWYLHILDPS